MPEYRIYALLKEDPIAGPAAVITADSDAEVVAKAKRLMNGHAVIEVWDLGRHVAKLSTTNQGLPRVAFVSERPRHVERRKRRRSPRRAHMAPDNDKYRQHAEEAQQQADSARNDSDKQSWLKIAQGWMQLIRDPKTEKSSAFDQQEKSQGTNQKKSDSDH